MASQGNIAGRRVAPRYATSPTSIAEAFKGSRLVNPDGPSPYCKVDLVDVETGAVLQKGESQLEREGRT